MILTLELNENNLNFSESILFYLEIRE